MGARAALTSRKFSEMDLAISSFVRKTSSSSILGTVARTTSYTYASICLRGFERR
jgi:hypothetical protein